MYTEPLRAVILDNDETTGSYQIVYSILKSLKKQGNIDKLLFYHILEKLATWMVKESVFRPGLIAFLKTLVVLKKENKIDVIIMYTNQHEPDTNIVNSLPRCIQYMFMFLVPGFFFDHMLTRPETTIVINNIYTKQFKRVLDLYPRRPFDNTQMIFFDDLASPLYVRDDDIKIKSDSSRVLVKPFSCILSKEQIEKCIRFCLDDLVDYKTFTDSVMEYYLSFDMGIDNNLTIPMDCSYFIDLVKSKYNSDGK